MIDDCIVLQKLYHYGIRAIYSMIGSIRISLIVFKQLKLVQRFLLNSLGLVASFKGPCCGLYY